MEAWMTSAVTNEDADNAVVLAESIRRTKSRRIVTVIASPRVSTEKRFMLRKVFDAVFLMEDTQNKAHSELQATLFAFSIRFLDKVVFLSNKSILLENADSVFEDKLAFKSMTKMDGSVDMSMFGFQPNKELWEYLWEHISHQGNSLTEMDVSAWLKNQQSVLKMGKIEEDTITKFSVAKGVLSQDITHAPIIQMVDVRNGIGLRDQLASLKGLQFNTEVIVSTWMEIHIQAMESMKQLQNAPVLKSRLDQGKYRNEPVAIVGMSCRYPGANNLEEFWNLLYSGGEAAREPPAFRWTKQHSVRFSQQARKTNAGFLSTTVDEFDARFFGVSPKEAAYMDPQSRLLHEVMWESLEDSGIDPLSLHGSHTGIFTGSWLNDYSEIVRNSTESDFFRTYMGNSIGAAAARLSFLLGLTGPSVATESGCSSAIVALDLAVKSLRNGETNLALAGGVNLILHPFTCNMIDHVISPDGRCKTFDEKADGFGRAEGCGVLVLKRMSDALRDQDNIWALIRGSAISQEGLSRSMGTPTVHCEALAMQLALQDANVSPSQVSFVETHGTGTPVGDPMEVSAIAKAYFAPDRQTPLVIGSVKTNVGHTESCSGITGIMKTVLAMQHSVIPKHRNLNTINPEIFLDSIPAIIPLENLPWPKVNDRPRIAGVSSFGITGTDGHVIIEEAPDYQLPRFDSKLERPRHILKICGKTSEALEEMLTHYENKFSDYAECLGDKKAAFSNAAFTANVGRASFNHRVFLIAQNYDEAIKQLKDGNLLQGEVKDEDSRQICFLFTGQGSQYHGMAKTLYETSPVFRVNFDACDRMLREMYSVSIRDALWESEPSSKEISRTIYSQTSIFCVEYCLLKLWESWGIVPDFVLGHSLGEFAAAVAAGILDFKDALKLVAERSKLIDSLPPGSMLVIKAAKPEVEKLLSEAKMDLDFAAVNNPDQTVVAGDTPKIEAFLRFVKEKGLKAIILEATHAFHSRHMDPILANYRKIASSITNKNEYSNVQYVSGMEGRIITDISEIDADYWVRHTREKVSFIDACTSLQNTGCSEYLEIGPQPVLSSFVMMNTEGKAMSCFPSLRRGADDWQTMLESLGKLFLLGYKVDWKNFDKPYLRSKIELPFHPLKRKSFWVEITGGEASNIHPLVGHRMNNASAISIFQNDVTLKAEPYLRDHRIGDRIVFPGAGYTEMMLSAGYCVANGLTETLDPPGRPIQLKNVRIEAPLELFEEKSCRFQVIVDLPVGSPDKSDPSVDSTGFQVKVFHQNTSNDDMGKWWLHSTAAFVPVASTKEVMAMFQPKRLEELMTNGEVLNSEDFYKQGAEMGLKFGETFRTIRKVKALKNTTEKGDVDDILVEIKLPANSNKYLVHPLIIDSVFQAGILTKYRYHEQKLHVPVRIGQLTMLNDIDPGNDTLYCYAWCDRGLYNGAIVDPNGTPFAILEDVEMLETNVRTIESVLEQQSSCTADAWEESWKPIPSPFTTATEIYKLDDLNKVSSTMEELKGYSVTDEDSKISFSLTKQLISWHILDAFYQLGWKPTPGATLDVQTFCSELNIKPNFYKLIRFYFTVLQEDAGILEKTTEGWTLRSISAPTQEQVTTARTEIRNKLKASRISNYSDVIDHVSQNAPRILKGEESPLSILFPMEEDKQHLSADAFYQNHPARNVALKAIMKSLGTIMEGTLANSGPDKIFRVLEVGSGTGSLSLPSLETIKKHWGDRFEFYFTDISRSFFIKAEKKLADFQNNIKYAVFNIEESPLSQGVPVNYFDLILATDVLHATRNLEETLTHLRQTLRPDGVLGFTETISQSREITFVFGMLDGYWGFEDFHWRPHHTCVSEETWELVLERTGFENVKAIKIYNDELALMLASGVPTVKVEKLKFQREVDVTTKKSWYVFVDDGWVEESKSLANMLDSSGYRVVIVRPPGSEGLQNGCGVTKVMSDFSNQREWYDLFGMEGADDINKAHGIVYGWGMAPNETDQSRVALPFLQVAKTVVDQKKPPKLFVLSKGLRMVKEDSLFGNPVGSTILGMLKALKNENWDAFVRSVDFAVDSSSDTFVSQLFYEICATTGNEQHRVQVAYRDNSRFEPRLVKATHSTAKDSLKLPPSTDRYHLVLPKSRTIQDLEFEPLEADTLKKTDVEVKVMAYGLNFRDIFAIMKPSAEFESINAVGLDFSGVVTKVGEAVTNIQVGDRVYGANFSNENQLPSHQKVDLEVSVAFKMPASMTYWEGATIPAVYLTVVYSFLLVDRISKNDTVLIHTGSGGVGHAAIQIAKHFGATIITTAGNPRKRAYLRSLGIQHVFHSRNTSYEQDIMRATNGRGVDLVLNSLTGPGFKEATLRSCAKNARFIEMSKLSVWSHEEVEALRPDVKYTIVDLTALSKDEGDRLFAQCQDFTDRGIIKPLPFVKYDALNIRQALQYFQKGKNIGKVVCAMPEVIKDEGLYKVKVPLFNSESTYWITGGLGGGIGFEVCKWMLSLGATDIILSGRNPPRAEIAAEIQSMNEKGFNVMIKLGDIGNYEHCKSIIDGIDKRKTLRGIMHCAGVIKDNLYRNQTWEDFQATFTPKVTGTWNLHRVTKGLPLEHFVVYSSIAALVGTPSQPNHAAANCFEDAFIHYRHSMGLPGTTINWGQWAQVGVAKEISLTGIRPVSLKRMLSGLEETLRIGSKQVCYCDFDAFKTTSILIPIMSTYLDERLWNQENTDSASAHGLNVDEFWKEMDGKATKEEKIEVMSTYIKVVLRTTLRLGSNETIGDNANLQDLGVDSLMMIELKNGVQTLLGTRLVLTATMLKNCNTVRLISNVIVSKLMEDDEPEEALNTEPLEESELRSLLIRDTTFDESISVSGPPCKSSEIRHILVTGATGRLAPYIISSITNNYPHIDKIICLVRTASESQSAMDKFKANISGLNIPIDFSKIECVVGNVVSEHLGLQNDAYKELCSKVDAIIHCASTSNYGEHYRPETSLKLNDTRSVNVGGTRNIIKFATEAKTKRVYFASNILSGLFSEGDRSVLGDFWPGCDSIEDIILHKLPGLQTSKLVSEMLLKQAVERGIPCKVFRFPWIGGESKTGRLNPVDNFYILRYLSFVKAKAMSSFTLPANILPVDACADISLSLFFDDNAPCEVYNIVHPSPSIDQEFVSVAKEEFGVDIEVLDKDAFYQRLDSHASNVSVLGKMNKDHKMLSNFMVEITMISRGFIESPETFFKNDKVKKYLPTFAQGLPSTIEVLRRDIRFLKSTGLLDQFEL